ncbi:MAG: hypothetical protein EOP45_04900 [Sphingobacteriaceae bacterium]|nr:MAG: hypothetical protein EOP45_04900 [Sphingobacteriaceae bacterium]
MADFIQIKQINLHHCKAATDSLGGSLLKLNSKKQPTIVLIQEPWIHNKKVKGMERLPCNIFYSKSNKPRTCVVTTTDIKACLLPQFCDGDQTAILVSINGENRHEDFILCSLYMPYESNKIPSSLFEELYKYSIEQEIALIVGADSNAHHTIWGSTNINKRGESLLEYLSSIELEVCNVGAKPTFVTGNRSEVIDISLISGNYKDRIKGWLVSDEPTLSDHREINFKLMVSDERGNSFRNPRKTDWNKYLQNLGQLIPLLGDFGTISSSNELDKAVEALSRCMRCAYTNACKCREYSPKRNHWWNKKLDQTKKELRRLERKFQQCNSPEFKVTLHNEVKRKRDLYKKDIYEAKMNSWRSFCEEVDGAKAMAKVNKLLAKDTDNAPGMLQTDTGLYTSTKEEAALLLLRTHFPGCEVVLENDMEIIIETTEVSPLNGEFDFPEEIFSMDRIKWAIFGFQPYKSPGYDGLYPILIQKAWEVIKDHIYHVYRASIRLHHVPTEWGEVKVTFIPKPGKEDYTIPKAFRPISLTSFMLKGLERVVERHVKEQMDVTTPLSDDQHAFREGRSTETALHEIMEDVETTVDKDDEFLMATFLDMEGAFDNLIFEQIEKQLTEKNVNRHIIAWIVNMLRNRHISYEFMNKKFTVKANRGTPQGGVLSPLLWNIVIDSLLRTLKDARIKVIGYADDVTLVVKGKFIDTVADVTQSALKIVEKWCRNAGLRINPNKSEQMIFTRRRNIPNFSPSKIFGEEIKTAKSVKYLGVHIDTKRNWKDHLENKVKKCTKIFWMCRKAIGKRWGLAPKCIEWLYAAIIKPVLAYAAAIWWKGTLTGHARSTLNHLQRMAALAINYWCEENITSKGT